MWILAAFDSVTHLNTGSTLKTLECSLGPSQQAKGSVNLSLPARATDRRLRQRVQVCSLMRRLPGQQLLAHAGRPVHLQMICLLYTSDAADE